ncbi:ABC transporter substrate-binding protein [Clostridium sp.]|uniref:substrate-binding periplasmic protein n=1 Tax=Clostridium sp. TaxID=1506 RepID=UPI0028470EE3|nr:ABC transporter substrate-binding protein [Clostridium sp.]MDR3597633.1 ABC transporter substrate-binding protein [Clostridium sp.]
MNKIYKKILILIIIIANFTILMCEFGTGASKTTTSNNINIKDRLDAIKEKGILTIASSNDKPFAFIDPKTNDFIGIDAEILTEAARRLGINKVEMNLVPFKYLFTELNSDNNIDIIANGLYITAERKKEALFTTPLYKEGEAILTLQSSNINSKEDLKNAIVGVQNGTVFLNLAQKWQKDGLIKELRIYQSQSDLILAITINEINVGITDSATAAYILQRYKNISFKMLTPYTPELPGIVAAAVRKTDTTLADAINKKVDEMKEDGTLLKILEKYGLNENNFIPVE